MGGCGATATATATTMSGDDDDDNSAARNARTKWGIQIVTNTAQRLADCAKPTAQRARREHKVRRECGEGKSNNKR